MKNDYYTYKNEIYLCNKCGWTGLGSKTENGEMFESGFEIHCPDCGKRFPGLISFPTINETLKKGNETDKAVASLTKNFREKWEASLLKNISQLPDLHFDHIAFVLKEIEENGEKYILITHQDKIIWKEILAYEYYDRFIEIGKLLKEKYGDKMVDLVPDVDGDYLYGDKIGSARRVENFRKELRGNKIEQSMNFIFEISDSVKFLKEFHCGICNCIAAKTILHVSSGQYFLSVFNFLGKGHDSTGLFGNEGEILTTYFEANELDKISSIRKISLIPFYCDQCHKIYCKKHWGAENMMGEDFEHFYYGTCPKGHRQALNEA